ncbi:uncharacterized protein [Nicotiana tomentosiformis]|uniref:uncharacterized protein n=1 Tax=Nicotiana tomentosiformis TaxID=4098 RepID=UPI00388C62EB
MVKEPMKQNPVRRLKKAKMEVHHPQKPRHLVTLEDFFPCWFRMKISRDGIEASCCNADKGEEKSDDLLLAPSLENLIESIPQEVNTCEEKVTFTNDDLLLADTPHNHPLYLVGYMHDEKNKVVPSTYHQYLKYYEGEVEKKIIVDDEPFTEAESHFADAKFYSKNHIVKELKADDGMKNKNNEPTTKRAEVMAASAKAVTEEVQPNMNKSHRGDIASYDKKVSLALQYVPKRKKDEGESSNLQTNMLNKLTLPVKQIEAVKLSSKPLAGLFAKVRYNPNELSKLGKLPLEAATGQPHEGLGYKQQSPMRIFIRSASSNYITVEDKSDASNKPSVFDRLGKSTVKPYTVVYTKEYDKDEESVGSSYHISALGENGVSILMEDDEKLEDVSLCYHISFNDRDPQEDEDAKDAPPELEEGVKTTVDTLKEVNLGTDEESRPTYLSALLVADEESTYMELLKEFKDVFAWSYKEMPGLDTKVVVHHLAVKNGARPIKQDQRRFRPDLVPLIESEVNKLIEAGFIREVKYPTWVSSIVPLMIDATTGYEAMSFMDGSSGYNQICMAPKDEELTEFRTPKGIYCYKVMPFGLKNAGATYQRAIQNILDDLLHKNVECYVDELVVKSRKKSDHLKDLEWCLSCSGVFSVQKLKHYFQAHVVRLVSKANTIKFVMSKPVLSDRLAMDVKGQALVDFLVDHPIPDHWELTDELPDENAMVIEVQPPWKMYFDGAAHCGRAGAGIVFITSQVELQVFGDSQLVINQILGSYEVKKPKLHPYHDYVKNLIGWVGGVTIQHVPRKENKKVDALAALASSLALPDQTLVTVCQKWIVPPPNEVEGEGNELKHFVVVSEAEKEEWR